MPPDLAFPGLPGNLWPGHENLSAGALPTLPTMAPVKNGGGREQSYDKTAMEHSAHSDTSRENSIDSKHQDERSNDYEQEQADADDTADAPEHFEFPEF